MKVAIIGSRQYENVRKIKNLLTDLRRKFGNELVIISGGAKDGADKYAKKFVSQFILLVLFCVQRLDLWENKLYTHNNKLFLLH